MALQDPWIRRASAEGKSGEKQEQDCSQKPHDDGVEFGTNCKGHLNPAALRHTRARHKSDASTAARWHRSIQHEMDNR